MRDARLEAAARLVALCKFDYSGCSALEHPCSDSTA